MQYDYSYYASIKQKEFFDGLSRLGYKICYLSVFKDIELIGEHHKLFNIPILPGFISYSIQILILSLIFRLKTNYNYIITWSLLEGFLSLFINIFYSDTKLVMFLGGDALSVTEYSSNSSLNKKMYLRLLRWIEKFTFRKIDKIVFLTEHNRCEMTKRAELKDLSKTAVVYHSINTKRINKLAKKDRVKFGNKKVIGFVGDLSGEVKGLNYLIKAFANVKKDVKDSLLVLVGEGSDKEELISLVQSLGLKDDVVFTGFQKNPIKYMKGFDILVLPSTTEGFGKVILESMSVGVPVIGSNVDGITEVLEYDDLLFEPRNINELTLKLVSILRNKQVYENVALLCEQRKKFFTFDWISQMESILKQI